MVVTSHVRKQPGIGRPRRGDDLPSTVRLVALMQVLRYYDPASDVSNIKNSIGS
jgi:hypothetical protein